MLRKLSALNWFKTGFKISFDLFTQMPLFIGNSHHLTVP
nr:MAG TPA: hypothetical protein [Caudoviricetes sp.]